MLDEADKMPGNTEYSDAYPIGISAAVEAGRNYMEINSGEAIMHAMSDDPAFLAGTALRVYLGEQYFEFRESMTFSFVPMFVPNTYVCQ